MHAPQRRAVGPWRALSGGTGRLWYSWTVGAVGGGARRRSPTSCAMILGGCLAVSTLSLLSSAVLCSLGADRARQATSSTSSHPSPCCWLPLPPAPLSAIQPASLALSLSLCLGLPWSRSSGSHVWPRRAIQKARTRTRSRRRPPLPPLLAVPRTTPARLQTSFCCARAQLDRPRIRPLSFSWMGVRSLLLAPSSSLGDSELSFARSLRARRSASSPAHVRLFCYALSSSTCRTTATATTPTSPAHVQPPAAQLQVVSTASASRSGCARTGRARKPARPFASQTANGHDNYGYDPRAVQAAASRRNSGPDGVLPDDGCVSFASLPSPSSS